MPSTSNVLVVPAGTEIGLEIRESLASSKYWKPIGVNSLRDHSEVAYQYVELIGPFARDEGFLEAVQEASLRLDCEFVIPAHDDAIVALAGHDFGKATFVGPNSSLASILRYKSKTYDALRPVVDCPNQIDLSTIRDSDFPIFAKPDRGQGSRGASMVMNREQLERVLKTQDEYVISEYLPGDEYTVDCYTNFEGRVIYASSRLRDRVINGISVRTSEVRDDRIGEIAHRISAALALRGAWFFQVKAAADGKLKLLEVANRVSGTMGFQRERGVNLVEAWLHELAGREVEFLPWEFGSIVFDRALSPRILWDYLPDTVYVDLDDTIILPTGKLNYRLIGNLFGLKFNLRARIVLLTRHMLDIPTTLSKFALSDLFDEIRHCGANEPKSQYIDSGRAIFIDDSFSERAEVWRHWRIPTFPVEAIACVEGLNHSALGDGPKSA